MSRSIFGWDLPPGCTMRDVERATGGDMPPFCEDCEEYEECDQTSRREDLVTCEKLKQLIQSQKEEAEAEAKFYEELTKKGKAKNGNI